MKSIQVLRGLNCITFLSTKLAKSLTKTFLRILGSATIRVGSLPSIKLKNKCDYSQLNMFAVPSSEKCLSLFEKGNQSRPFNILNLIQNSSVIDKVVNISPHILNNRSHAQLRYSLLNFI